MNGLPQELKQLNEEAYDILVHCTGAKLRQNVYVEIC